MWVSEVVYSKIKIKYNGIECGSNVIQHLHKSYLNFTFSSVLANWTYILHHHFFSFFIFTFLLLYIQLKAKAKTTTISWFIFISFLYRQILFYWKSC